MKPPIALQLYTLRALAQEDFEGTVRKVAEMGYVGVEPAGFPGSTPEAAGKLFAELGLQVPSAHTALPLGDSKNEVLDAMAAIGCPRVITGKGPDDFNTLDKIRATPLSAVISAANPEKAGTDQDRKISGRRCRVRPQTGWGPLCHSWPPPSRCERPSRPWP